jgi:general secretion pathway protein E
MIGEIRDRETATIAVQAALTGHLVLSTLHTNDSHGAVARLADMGVESFLIASSLSAVIAQKLVRRICKGCKVSYTPAPEVLKALGIPSLLEGKKTLSLAKGEGCQQCRGSGYAGRIGIFEFLPIDDAIRNQIVSRAPSAEIRKAALLGRMKPLRVEGILKALQGITTIEEVLRVTQEIEE